MDIKKIYQLVLDFEDEEIVNAVDTAIAEGIDPNIILNEGLISAMDEVGKLFAQGDLFVPEMLMAANTMKAGMSRLKQELNESSNVESKGVIVIGTVEGDLHDIGKNLVTMLLESSGFTVYDLGYDIKTEIFMNKIEEVNADIVCLSALLSTTMANMRDTVQVIKNKKPNIKIMVGGAPVTEDFANEIGADAYGEDAGEAVLKAKELI